MGSRSRADLWGSAYGPPAHGLSLNLVTLRISVMRIPFVSAALLLAILAGAGCNASDTAPRPAAGASAAAARPPGSDSAFLAAADRSRIQGADSAPVWLLIVSDFQCPFCRQWHEQSYDAIVREYVRPGKVRVAYVNLPIGSHQNAKPAAEAAMCAGVQGKFWQMADGIFRTQERWASMPVATAMFDSIAGAQTLDMTAWRGCVTEHRTAGMVEADAMRANQIGIGSTPSFVVMRGQDVVRGIEGAYPVDTFRVVLDAALAGPGTPARP